MPVSTTRSKRRYLYPLLTLYLLAGTAITPFHADEADHLFKARDYVIYFVIGDPARLRVDPPVAIDSEQHVRLLTGTTSAYLTGMILWHSGYTDLDHWNPPWYYPDSLAENLAAGRRPPPDVLWRGRLASTFLTMFAALILFRIAEKLAGERAALITLLMFVLHPVILLNGRRIMQEGALLCFSLLVVYLGMRVLTAPHPLTPSPDSLRSEGRGIKSLPPTEGKWGRDLGWGGVGLTIALALASKPTALLTITAILIGLSLLYFFQFTLHYSPFTIIPFALCPITFALVYLLLTPAIWSDPIQRSLLAANLRADVLRGQTIASEHAYDQPIDRITALLVQPFPAEVQYYESPQFVGLAPEIRAYQKSPWHGMMLPALSGSLLALIGMIRLIKNTHPVARLVLIWIGITAAGMVIAVPLGWQRYYLPWTVIVILLAGIGLNTVMQNAKFRMTR